MPDLFKIRSSVTFLQSSFFKGISFAVFSSEVNLLFCFAFYAADANNVQLFYVATAHFASTLPYVVLFDLKPLIEDGNLLVYMYCVHARRRDSGAPRTHFRACKISKFLGGVLPDPPHTIHFAGPHFLYLPLAPQSSRRPCMRQAWRLATLHGCSKRSGCGRVQVGPITFSQTKHAHELVRIRTSLVKPSPKMVTHHRANLLTKRYR